MLYIIFRKRLENIYVKFFCNQQPALDTKMEGINSARKKFFLKTQKATS